MVKVDEVDAKAEIMKTDKANRTCRKYMMKRCYPNLWEGESIENASGQGVSADSNSLAS